MSNKSSSDADLIDYLDSLSDNITYYFLMISMPFGLIGNLVSMFIYMRPKLNQKTNTGFLYSWLCVTNLICILWYIFIFRSRALFNYTVSIPGCGVSNYLRRTTLNMVPWMQVMISFDRFMAVVFPNRRNIMKKRVNIFFFYMKNDFKNL